MRLFRRLAGSFLFLAALGAVIGMIASTRAVDAPKSPERLAAERKISSWVTGRTENGKPAEFIGVLNDQAEKGRFVRGASGHSAP